MNPCIDLSFRRMHTLESGRQNFFPNEESSSTFNSATHVYTHDSLIEESSLFLPFYTSLLSVLFIVLSVRTLLLRRKLQVAVGDGGHRILQRAIRAHSNFIEYVPLSILLIFFAQGVTRNSIWTHVLCVTLLLGRILHAYGVSQVKEKFIFRISGIAFTFTVMAVAIFKIWWMLIIGVIYF